MIYEYCDGETFFEGYLAINHELKTKRPCIMVAHAWDGPNDHFNALADNLAQKGFIAFAIDVYGKGKRGEMGGDNAHLMNPLLEDRALLQKRLLAAFHEIQKHPLVIKDKIAILGYCFGGLCALDLARANPTGLRGTVSVHGGLASSNLETQDIDASILVLHGLEDPIVSTESVLSFIEEMTKAHADFQIHCYGHAKHAFTFVGADIPEFGIKYDKKAHKRSEKAMDYFFEEIFR
jgi:dienelactone hydrolase